MGIPHKMFSAYQDDKNKNFMMIHYCAVANQLKLILTGIGENKMTMDLYSDSDIDVTHEMPYLFFHRRI